MGVETADAVESAKFAAAEPIVSESGSPAEAARATEPVSSQVCVPKTATTKMSSAEVPATEMSSAEVPATEMAAGEMSPAEVPATEMTATEVPATETHASEMAASEAAEVTAAETTEMTAPEVTAAKTPEMTTAEMTAAAESTVPESKSFAYRARHHTRCERGFETEPERDRRCENFSHPTSHGDLLPPRCGTMTSLRCAHSQRMDGSARSIEFKYGVSLYKRRESSTKRARFTHRITKSCDEPTRHDIGPGGAIVAEACQGEGKRLVT
jgi:hypothetical protein